MNAYAEPEKPRVHEHKLSYGQHNTSIAPQGTSPQTIEGGQT
jgi:hypothetical protein